MEVRFTAKTKLPLPQRQFPVHPAILFVRLAFGAPDASGTVAEDREKKGGGGGEDKGIAGAGAIVDGALCALALYR